MTVERMRVALSGNYAAALAVKNVDVDVVSVYPITPSTATAERIAQYIADGELDAELITVESEHSALSGAVGASAAGARTFSVTSSQGLLLMHEILYIAAGLRLPIVMAVADRSVSAPINIWSDLSDTYDQRDTGWMIVYSTTVQELYDRLIQAYRIAEDPNVMLPMMVCYDGYNLSHTYAPVDILTDEEAREFTPKRLPSYKYKLDPDNPMSIGGFGSPDYYMETKVQEAEALKESISTIEKVGKEFGERFGRTYDLYDTFMMEDADVALIGMGSVMGTAKVAVRQLRKEGHKVGLVNLHVYRPFPTERLVKELKDLKALGVLGRAVSPGAPGGVSDALTLDVMSSLYLYSVNLPVKTFIAGLGGRDIPPSDFVKMFEELEAVARGESTRPRLLYVSLRSENKEVVL